MSKTASEHRPHSQLSLVAFYQPKPADLAAIVRRCQEIAYDGLGPIFQPYGIDQVHATIVGMEMVVLPEIDDVFINQNAHLLRDKRIEMRFENLQATIYRHLPMSIRWGGYKPDDLTYEGRLATPFSRSIYLNRTTGKLVLIGWPHVGGDFRESRLLDLRDELESECGLVHKYGNDNDFFQVLGSFELDAVRQSVDLDTTEQRLAEYIDSFRLDTLLDAENCQIVCYAETALPVETTTAISIVSEELSPDRIRNLYLTPPLT